METVVDVLLVEEEVVFDVGESFSVFNAVVYGGIDDVEMLSLFTAAAANAALVSKSIGLEMMFTLDKVVDELDSDFISFANVTNGDDNVTGFPELHSTTRGII